MKVIKAKVENFSSYKHLELDFTNQGLCLISGPTGSGKSTLCDIVPWILFGRTSKGGPVDEVRRWNSEDSTIGNIELSVNNSKMVITRSRGQNNDLNYQLEGVLHRGKDLTDTQKQINQLLGIDLELYLSGAYFHEFSSLATFFIATAKQRRELTEQLADLTLPVKLTEQSAVTKKTLNKTLIELESSISTKTKILNLTQEKLKNLQTKSEYWNNVKQSELDTLSNKSTNFEKTKSQLLEKLYENYYRVELELKDSVKILKNQVLPDDTFESKKTEIQTTLANLPAEICSTCGAKTNADTRLLLTHTLYAIQQNINKNKQLQIDLTRTEQLLERHHNPNSQPLKSIEAEMSRENTYTAELERKQSQTNPFSDLINEERLTRKELKQELDTLNTTKTQVLFQISDLEVLSSIINDLRKHLVKVSIMGVEVDTNKLLDEYFDSEIKVNFELKDADKLEVVITKDGNDCSYTQLSKGQRQLLKLCFVTSIMKTINTKYLDFNAIFLDEFADGCDDDLKVKSFRLLEDLATRHESVFCVDHSEALKSMFTNKIKVTLINGQSEISYE